jgi:hypothetical protein
MKKTILGVAFLAIFACRTEHPNHFSFSRIDGETLDLNCISVSHDTFYYQSFPVAAYTNMELECLESNCVTEISVSQFSPGFSDTTEVLMKFLHHQHPHSKIEIKVK